MKILTKKNGMALVGVLVVLFVLTLFIPLMLTMSEDATRASVKGTDTQRASYLARTMIEMTVAAFEDFYDAAEDGNTSYQNKLNQFTKTYKKMDATTLYMYRIDDVTYPEKPLKKDYIDADSGVFNEEAYNNAYAEFETALNEYEVTGIEYTTTPTNAAGYTLVGTAECSMTYDDSTKYYSIDAEGNTTLIDETKYAGGKQALEDKIANGVDVTEETQYIKIDNKNIVFQASATVNGKTAFRRCVLILPTKPSEQRWIVPASLGSNQIFPDTSFATGRTNIKYDAGTFIDGSALKQPLYIFSCLGNMVISDKDMKVERTNANGVTEVISYVEYMRENNMSYDNTKMSFGLHPETGTREPDNDPEFNCLRTYNMESWANDAQLDNFVAFTATNGIQVDLPVNLIMNPSRTGRIGDGFDKNYSLYKVLIFQAPTIVFNKAVNSFVSLNVEDNAYRMTSIMFAAPKSTPYSYLNGSRGKTVKAGKVFFAQDVYIWLIPYDDDGSSYKTQTVYYKNDDIILYKIANAGDIYYFNSEIETTINGKPDTTGFSLTGYFMDTIYNEHGDDFTNNNWWNVWSNAKQKIFNNLVSNFSEPIYEPDDFKWIGNVYSDTGDKLPIIDDFYVVWDS